MWYFSWILGVSLASSFAILNAMWFEMKSTDAKTQVTSAGKSRLPLK